MDFFQHLYVTVRRFFAHDGIQFPIEVLRYSVRRLRTHTALPNLQFVPLLRFGGRRLLCFGKTMLFDTGQTTAHKMRLANKADAAVYSGLVWEARSLNYQAYLNRAMVANQVSIAQVVSLVSWSEYLKTTAVNINTVVVWIPVVGQFTATFAEVTTEVNEYFGYIGEIAVSGINALIVALSNIETAVNQAGVASALSTLSAVVERNDPRFRVVGLNGSALASAAFMAKNVADYENFTKTYSSDDDLERFAKVVDNSRDDFTANRGWSLPMADVGIYSIMLVKVGKTELIRNKPQADTNVDGGVSSSSSNNNRWEWKAKDTISVHTKHVGWCWDGPCWKYDEIPVGWGEAFASSSSEDIEQCDNNGFGWFWSATGCPPWSSNRIAEMFADANAQQIDASYSGLQSYRDLADLSADNKRPHLDMGIEVTLAKQDTRTVQNIDGLGAADNPDVPKRGVGQGIFALKDAPAGDVSSAVSRGEVYFERPIARQENQFGAQDNLDEFGNLFNPYWDVRLTNPAQERQLAWAARGLQDLLDKGLGGSLGF